MDYKFIADLLADVNVPCRLRFLRPLFCLIVLVGEGFLCLFE